MNTYYLREVYFATGEGVTTILAVGQAENKKAFLELCISKGVDEYYLKEPFILINVDQMPHSELEMLKEEHFSLYKRLTNHCHRQGTFWWVHQEHFNMS